MRSFVALKHCHQFIILLKMATGSDPDALIFTYRYSTLLTHNSRTATQSLFDTY